MGGRFYDAQQAHLRGMSAGCGRPRYGFPAEMNMNYAIVDAARCANSAAVLHGYAAEGRARALFAGQPESPHADAGPWLVILSEDPVLHQWLFNLEPIPGAVCRFSSTVNVDAVVVHLQARMALQLTDGGMALFRLWDGRALYRMWGVMTQAQKAAFIAPFSRWSVQLQGRRWELDHMAVEKP
ncbi:DUF4123 domain-containing protein [Stenotrophomonas maltophilia]|nr:DUF4123 domain-containing protein [Stenotrophomonas maltophilia]